MASGYMHGKSHAKKSVSAGNISASKINTASPNKGYVKPDAMAKSSGGKKAGTVNTASPNKGYVKPAGSMAKSSGGKRSTIAVKSR